ncbi:uncharacterized protein [Penaeus vannamei]|uniref:uncharacterized protein n=1 Tax=Penaeus vannamei TaxID=6689 RepID=UPI00387F3F8F
MALQVLGKKSLVMVTVVTLLVTQLHGTVYQTPSKVLYITSAPFGNFLVAPGMSIQPWDAFALLEDIDSCSCKVSCWAATACVAWSFVTLADGSSQCRLANKGPTDLDVVERSNATYYFKESSVPGVYSFKADRLLYLTPSMLLPYEDAKALCARIPGHRLGMYKTVQQLNMLEEYWCLPGNCPAALYMYLEKTSKGVLFGDGTPLSATEIGGTDVVMNAPDAYTFIFYNKKVDDDYPTAAKSFLCQANPMEVGW